MPRIQLSRNPAIRSDFVAHIFWPNDKEKRQAYVRLTDQSSLALLEEAQDESVFKNIFVAGHYDIWTKHVRKQFADDVIDLEGTAKSVSLGHGINSLEKERQKNAVDVFLTGYVIIVLSTMLDHHSNDTRLRGGPGIKKAQEVVADIQVIALSRVELAWSKYKTVAHFCATAVLLSEIQSIPAIDLLWKPTAEFIAVSQYYRLLLTTFKPHGRSAPLVPEQDLWLPPKDWECNATRLICSPLPEKNLNALANRKAR